MAGPVEATALGNVLVQARALGLLAGDLETLRALVRATQDIRRFEPRPVRRPGQGLTDARRACSSPATTTSCSPRSGQAVVRLVRRLGHDIEFPAEQTCCGQMHFNSGYQDGVHPARRAVRRRVRRL